MKNIIFSIPLVVMFSYASLFIATAKANTSDTVISTTPGPTEWIRQFGTPSNDFSYSVTTDPSGYVYITGYTRGSLEGTNFGSADAFLSKFDSDGNKIWGQQIGTPDTDWGESIAVDDSGNAYITGITAAIPQGINGKSQSTLLAKYDTFGNEIWRKQIGTPNNDAGKSVAIDNAGNIYVGGFTSGNFESNTFLQKLNSNGDELWIKQMDTTSIHEVFSIATDDSGNVYVSGDTEDDLEGSNAGIIDAFLTKFNGSGVELWTQQIGTRGVDLSNSVAVDGSGNAYISGFTNDAFEGASEGMGDAFLTKFSSSGTELWTQQFGSPEEYDEAHSLAIDSIGNIYIAGRTSGDLGGTNAGSTDVFLTIFNSDGRELSTQQVGSSGAETGSSVAVDGFGNAYISGVTYGNMSGINAGGADAFLLKFTSTVPEPSTLLLGMLTSIGLLRYTRR